MNEANLIKLQTKKLIKGLHMLELDEARAPEIMSYLQLLQKWNKTYNLTAITSIPDMVTHHALDALAVMVYFQGERILDVGTGGGIPGVLLAIMYPEKHIVLLDAVGKKCRFLRQVKRELKLDNIEVVHARVEKYMPDEKFDVVTSRAFAEVSLFLSLTSHLGHNECCYLAMKGAKSESIKTIETFEEKACWDINVPFLDVKRKLYHFVKR